MPQASNTFLIVDDEKLMERLFRGKFRKEIRSGEVRLLFAGDGAEALQRLGKHPDINIIFSDLNMPGMDGVSLLQKLQEQHQSIVSIIITAYGDYDRLKSAMNAGAFDFLSKPLDFKDLQKTLDRALDAQRQVVKLKLENKTLKHALDTAYEHIAELKQRLGSMHGVSHEKKL